MRIIGRALRGIFIDGSFDVHSGTIDGMFDFGHPSAQPLFLDPTTGEPDPGSGS